MNGAPLKNIMASLRSGGAEVGRTSTRQRGEAGACLSGDSHPPNGWKHFFVSVAAQCYGSQFRSRDCCTSSLPNAPVPPTTVTV